MFSSEHTICAVDHWVWQAIKAENKRQPKAASGPPSIRTKQRLTPLWAR
jgi:hypothetical protein